MFADDKKGGPKGTLKPQNIVSPDAAPEVSGEQLTKMAGGVGEAVGGTAGKRINQAAELAQKAMDAKATVLAGGVTPANIVATGPAPDLTPSAEQVTGALGKAGEAIGGKAGKAVSRVADELKNMQDIKAKVLSDMKPMNL